MMIIIIMIVIIIIYAYLCSEFGVRLFFDVSRIIYLGRKMQSYNL